jgi:hypothetical protein
MPIFTQNTAILRLKSDYNIGFQEKRQFFRWKLVKIAKNFDHNFAPRPVQRNKSKNLSAA